MSTFTHNTLRYNTYRQVFQLQLTDCVVRFDVFWDEGKLEIGVIKDSIPLLSVRPILGTFYLKKRCTFNKVTKRERQWGYWSKNKTCWDCQIKKENSAYRSFLYDSVEHHHTAAPLLPHHLPEVATCIWKGSLKNNDCCVRRVILSLSE